MTIFPTVVSAAQLVSGLVSTAKNARDLAKDSSDHALKAAVGDLYDAVLDVKARVIDLDEENRSLKTQLVQREEIEGPDDNLGYFCFKRTPDKPLCPRCYQSVPSKVTYMGPRHEQGSYVMRSCPVCNFSVREATLRQVRRNINYNPYA